MVKVGQQAPEFVLKDQDNKDVKLSDFKGKKVLLAFFPFAFSPVCTDEFGCFQEEKERFDPVEILGISVDSHWSNNAFKDSLNLSYPLLSDFSKKTSAEYGVLRKEGFSERAYFVIDEQGKIIYKKVMDNPATKLENDELLAEVK